MRTDVIDECAARFVALHENGAAQVALHRLDLLQKAERECEAVFLDDGAIPTRTQRAADRRIGAPDRAVVTVQEGDAQVVSGGIVDPATGRVLAPDVRRPADLRLPEGIGGNGAVRLRWLVRGSGTLLVTYRAEKGGSASLTVDLK